MQKWEYLFVVCESLFGIWRPRYFNDKEIRDWKDAPEMSIYSNELGEKGWELVNVVWSFSDYPLST